MWAPRYNVRRRGRRSAKAPILHVDQAIILDLAAAALNAGISIPRTLEALHVALGGDDAHQSRGRFLTSLQGIFRFGPARGSRFGHAAPKPRSLQEVANSLLMGATWEESWQDVHPRFQLLATALEPAWSDGAAPVPLLERSALTLRLTRQRQAKEAAARLGSRLVLPLGLCFLPAFMLIGVLPVIVLTAQNVL
ncbi:hypothetical protein EZJ44_01875 [Arcanobacterium bovis]|uniref:Type II secretion system protein GspF domain-containing protein n=2 Tax=Arcanobacterium bovis TaxID=2529275 RepID=A0A4Q9V2P8_9ACTO|nr:hypothetical protein EZJ44_01875 [Arcanobacterium bovis]